MSDQNEISEFDEWAIVEIMGRKVFAGRVRDSSIGGASMLRIDVPEIENQAAYTKYFGKDAIYAITPTDEATARAMAQRLAEPPIERWIMPRLEPALPEADLWDEEEQDYIDDDYDPYEDESGRMVDNTDTSGIPF